MEEEQTLLNGQTLVAIDCCQCLELDTNDIWQESWLTETSLALESDFLCILKSGPYPPVGAAEKLSL